MRNLLCVKHLACWHFTLKCLTHNRVQWYSTLIEGWRDKLLHNIMRAYNSQPLHWVRHIDQLFHMAAISRRIFGHLEIG